MKLELLMSCGSDETIANTARVSMQTGGNWYELPEGYDEGKAKKLIHYLATHKHTSPFRHTSITVRCSVPIFIARQLGKHQVGMSWNEVSRRYVDEKPTFYFPKEWRERPAKSIKQGSGGVMKHNELIVDWYSNHIDYVVDKYEEFLEMGMAPEMARMILPQSMNTEFIWTGSVMAFAHVYNLRIDGHAQVEAQEFASELDKIIRPLFPHAWESLVGEPK